MMMNRLLRSNEFITQERQPPSISTLNFHQTTHEWENLCVLCYVKDKFTIARSGERIVRSGLVNTFAFCQLRLRVEHMHSTIFVVFEKHAVENSFECIFIVS